MIKALKTIKLNESPSITISVMGQMKSGKSTLINAILGKTVVETKIQRSTLCQATIRISSDESKDNTNQIRLTIENMNKTMREQNKLEEVTELDCKIQSSLFQDLVKDIKYSVNLVDTIGYNEDSELGNDDINYKKLKENMPYTDVYMIPTKPDALLQQGDEKKTFRTLLQYIKEQKVSPLLFVLINKKDTFEDEDVIMTECKKNVTKELEVAGLANMVQCVVFPVSARYIGMHRIFLQNNTIEDFDDDRQIGLFAKYVLGKRKANQYITDLTLKENKEGLNKVLLDELKGSDWDKDTGFDELKTKVFESISHNESEIIFKGYQNSIRTNFTNYDSKKNGSILQEILSKIQFTNRYKNSEYWDKIIEEFKTELMRLTRQLNKMNFGNINVMEVVLKTWGPFLGAASFKPIDEAIHSLFNRNELDEMIKEKNLPSFLQHVLPQIVNNNDLVKKILTYISPSLFDTPETESKVLDGVQTAFKDVFKNLEFVNFNNIAQQIVSNTKVFEEQKGKKRDEAIPSPVSNHEQSSETSIEESRQNTWAQSEPSSLPWPSIPGTPSASESSQKVSEESEQELKQIANRKNASFIDSFCKRYNTPTILSTPSTPRTSSASKPTEIVAEKEPTQESMEESKEEYMEVESMEESMEESTKESMEESKEKVVEDESKEESKKEETNKEPETLSIPLMSFMCLDDVSDIQDTFKCIKSISNIFKNNNHHWLVESGCWNMIQEQIASLIYMTTDSEEAMKKVHELHCKGFFDLIDINKNKTFSRLFTTFWVEKLKKIGDSYEPNEYTTPTWTWEKVLSTDDLHDGDMIITTEHKIGRLKIQNKLDLDDTGSIRSTTTYMMSSKVEEKGITHYTFTNVDIQDIQSVLRLECPNLESRDMKTYISFFENMDREIGNVIYDDLLIDTDKKLLFQNYLKSKEKVFHNNTAYASQIQRLVRKEPNCAYFLYDYLASVIHLTIPRKERLKRLSEKSNVSTTVERLFCQFERREEIKSKAF